MHFCDCLVGFSLVKSFKRLISDTSANASLVDVHMAVVDTVETCPSVFTCSTSLVYVRACMC